MTLYTERHGRGQPVLVIHGGLGLDQSYMQALDRLADIAELIYVDVPGNGRSSHDDTFTMESIVDELDGLRAELGFERWTVLGHSFGSFLALTYAIRYPDRVAALIAITSAPSFDHAPKALAHLDTRGQPEAAAALRAHAGQPARDDAQLAEVWNTILPLYFHNWHEKHRASFARTRWSAAGYNRGAALLATYDVRKNLAKITCPTLVVAADDDFITPVELCGRPLATAIADARLVVIRQSGHYPFLEAPVAFDTEVRAWLTALAPRT